jgi:glycosyltransferase involved in cell wall biosynthesis
MDLQLRRRVRSELDIPDDGCLVVSASEMQSVQAYQDLLQVIPQVLEKFPLTRFVLLGEGPARAELVQISRQLGIASQMRFPGARPDLLRLIGAGDIYILPSSFDGMPPYLLEAMAAQRPVVACDCAQVQEFVQPGETGLLAATGDQDALLNALFQLLSDAEVRARIGRAGQEYVQRNHNLERMCAEYAILLDPSYHVEAL